jgi:hypothetical protein
MDRAAPGLGQPVIRILDELSVFGGNVVHHDAGDALDKLRLGSDFR